ncbi:elongation factor P 5-aminopentanone reductase [Alicyclobacillus kakegawensis]|uniref:elongation factor P 5-aminopentanone reductase n=1 Tax=Alicyclobacillus kakegawensis TaxID=392012 RepID=UPI00082D95DC|nr:3-oxoacyl-ACP reductase family protein [Alicyclobacillus kakegawensis]
MGQEYPEEGKPLSGQVAVVTGASRGIGRAVALSLAAAGARVIVNYHRAQKEAERVANQCRALADGALAVQADVAQPDEVSRLVSAATALGTPSILINNAGIAWNGLFQETPWQTWQQLIAVNLTGVYLCTQAVLPYMLRAEYGRIINIASVWGVSGGACEAAYSASKGGVIALTRALAKELGRTGITVNAVAPGAIATDMTASLATEDASQLLDEIPVGRIGAPEEVAHCVRFLALPASSYITGQVLSPSGGLVT